MAIELRGERNFATWVRKHSPEKVTVEVGLEGGLKKRGGCPSNRAPSVRTSQWPRETWGDLNQTLILGTVRTSILPLLWWWMGCEHMKERDNPERDEVIDHVWLELHGTERWRNQKRGQRKRLQVSHERIILCNLEIEFMTVNQTHIQII